MLHIVSLLNPPNARGLSQVVVGHDERGRSKTRVVDYRREKATDIVRKTSPFVAVWALTWTPYAVLGLTTVAGYQELITPTWSMVPALIAKTSSVINPLIYILGHRVARTELLRKHPGFGKFFRCIYGMAAVKSTLAVHNILAPKISKPNIKPAKKI